MQDLLVSVGTDDDRQVRTIELSGARHHRLKPSPGIAQLTTAGAWRGEQRRWPNGARAPLVLSSLGRHGARGRTAMPAAQSAARPINRWAQLAFGVVCMMMIANLQYSWTLFVQPMNKAHGWAIADIQLAFSIFIALETWFTPAAGW